jgi:hypothetical protein
MNHSQEVWGLAACEGGACASRNAIGQNVPLSLPTFVIARCDAVGD